MKILESPINITELSELAANYYIDMIKAVADIDRNLIAIDAELHSDLESMLLEDGSEQDSLWGFNLYPDIEGEDFIEYDSLINIRPRLGNRSREVENPAIRKQILEIVNKYIVR